MKSVLFWLAVVAVAALVIFVIFGLVRSAMMSRRPDQALFVAGKVPNPLPEGLYKGTADGYQGSWQGKQFDPAQKSGINLFGGEEKYPFRTWVGAGIRDKNIDVLKIDYNVEGNPFWLRPILDEMVEVAPGKLLGKLQFRFIPGLPFTIVFFRLEK